MCPLAKGGPDTVRRAVDLCPKSYHCAYFSKVTVSILGIARRLREAKVSLVRTLTTKRGE